MRVKKAVIPAAGLGTRFLPATKAQPKEMLPLVDKPTIQYIVEEAVASGIEDILIITGRNKRAIEDHFDRSVELEVALNGTHREDLLKLVQDVSDMVDIHYVRQKEPRGLGHAVWCARKFIGSEPFAVLLGDDVVRSEVPALRQLMEVYERLDGSVLGVQEVPAPDVSRYGIIAPEPIEPRLFAVRDFIEKPAPARAPSRLAVLGRYILEPEIFPILEQTPPGAGGEIQLTDAIRQLGQVRPVYAYWFEGRRYDVGDKLGFLEATVELALERPDLGPAFRSYLEQLIHRPGGPAVASGVSEGKA
ncbi:UTP--glucose-1-phosphate uridylyltransferase GalU [Carboxydochorda subterranea]|uniref:UTP--glucose-1-phosphate uridylyltransferase n=1 Tax=Carboxydichorda subterranea TaxID=3109565 RepID=A0ABZ1BWD7_9FIRM|nr:UTP--glucose-1-phosphate uridylyltransferase GalU [Limnochorda sp. L945t]WRP16447.1 UTP--glucose-1-phosphate uridylyltransferase GalU [Limnochorda sp. L945t]